MGRLEKIKKKCGRFKYVSFDIYDTLIYRDVDQPKDVFKIIERFCNGKNEETIDDFAKLRAEAEIAARSSHDREITIDDIYEVIARNAKKSVCETYKKTENAVEIAVSAPNPGMIEVLNWCKEHGKTVLLVSDMYLSRAVIARILEKNHITNYDKLYLSSEIGKTKCDGALYDFVLKDCGIDAKQIIHIGDNWKSDFIRPAQKRIGAIHVKKESEGGKAEGPIEKEVLNAFLRNRSVSDANKAYFFGYSYLGSLLYGYVKWLESEFRGHDYDNILFFSREGCFIKKAYEKAKRPDSPAGVYFYASRRALFVPTLNQDACYQDMLEQMFIPYHVTVAWMIDHWGLDPQRYVKETKACGLQIQEKLNKFHLKSDERLQGLFYALKRDIVENSEKERRAFLAYLKKCGVHGKIAIVDIGWNGNMQKAFINTIRAEKLPIEISGYYLGYTTAAGNHTKQEMHGYLRGDNGSADFLVDYYIQPALEVMFMAMHGTVLRYREKEDVELAGFEYEGTKTERIVRDIQRGAMDFIEEYKEIGEYVENDPAVYSQKLLTMFKSPKSREIEYVEGIEAWDKQWIPLVAPSNLGRCLLRPKEVKNGIMNSCWKIGYLKRLVPLPINHYQLLKALRSKVIKKL